MIFTELIHDSVYNKAYSNKCWGGFLILFSKIKLEDKSIIDRFFQQGYYEASECTFTNLYMWRKYYQTEWAIHNNSLFIKANDGEHTFLLPPFGPENEFVNDIAKIKDYFQQSNQPFLLKGVPEITRERLEALNINEFCIQEDRNNSDYVYDTQDLVELKGRKYHGKKNHINHFKKNVEFNYLPLTADLIPDCIEFEIEWCKTREHYEDTLFQEKEGIIDAFHHFEYLGFKGAVIMIHDKIEAFTFGELLNPDMVVIHVEKGNHQIRGIYPIINQQFCEHCWSDTKYINREEDMGLAGLRKSKESYFPARMIDKYIVTLKSEV